MARIEGLREVIALMRKRAKEADANPSVLVGYTAAYAIYVHENLEMKLAGQPRPSGLGEYWGPAGQPKFLEQPARELRGELVNIIKAALVRGASLAQALMLAGLRLQRESQLLVPVEYSPLKNSAFTRLEGG